MGLSFVPGGFVVAVIIGVCQANAATLNATPRTFHDVIVRAHSGDTLVLAAGDYGTVEIADLKFEPPLTVDARAAAFKGLWLKRIKGLTLRGGAYRLPPSVVNPRSGNTISGAAVRMDGVERVTLTGALMLGPGAGGERAHAPYGDGYGVFVLQAANVQISDGRFEGFKSGIVLGRSRDFSISRNHFTGMRSDGIQVAEARQGVIEGNICGGTRIRDDEHPDCIQLWSRPTSPPTADIQIRGNRAEGPTQGISLFNHVRDGVNDGGFDRILIEDNDLKVGYPHAIALVDGRDSIVRNNRVETYEGARFRASINLTGASIKRCGNTVAPGAGKSGMKDPPCEN